MTWVLARRTMLDAMTLPDQRHEFVSVREAAIRLGTSESDVRRRIKRGELVAESLPRPGGTLLRVRLDTPDDTPAPSPAAPEPRQEPPEPRQDVSAAIEAATAPLAALAASLAETAQTQAATIQAQNAEIAYLRAQLDRLRRRGWWARLLNALD